MELPHRHNRKTRSRRSPATSQQNDQATTGNTDNEFARWITVTISGVQTTGPLYTYDASHRETSPYSGLPLSLLSRIGTFDTDDSYQQNGDETPAGADFTIGDFGVLTLVTLPVSIPFIFNDASTGEDYTYTLSFSLPSPGSAIRGGGVSISTGYGKLHTLNKIRGGGLSAAMGGGFITLSGGRTVPFTANLNDAFIVPVIFAELEFDSQTRYLHNDLGTITTLGHDWTGVGTFGSIEPLQERDDQSPTGTTLRLSGIDSVLLEEALVENYRDRPVTIYLGIRDATTGALTTAPMELFTGRMDQMRASAGGQTMSVEIVVESEMIDFQKALDAVFLRLGIAGALSGGIGVPVSRRR